MDNTITIQFIIIHSLFIQISPNYLTAHLNITKQRRLIAISSFE